MKKNQIIESSNTPIIKPKREPKMKEKTQDETTIKPKRGRKPKEDKKIVQTDEPIIEKIVNPKIKNLEKAREARQNLKIERINNKESKINAIIESLQQEEISKLNNKNDKLRKKLMVLF